MGATRPTYVGRAALLPVEDDHDPLLVQPAYRGSIVTAVDLDALLLHAGERGEAVLHTPPNGFELVDAVFAAGIASGIEDVEPSV